MPLGPDIKEIYQTVGIPYSVKHNGAIIASGEFLDYEPNTQVTKPFIREYFLEASLSYDTVAKSGDVILLDDGSDRKFLIMNKTPEVFEGEIISHDCVLYKSNITALIYRVSGEVRDPNTLQINTVWNLHASGEALLVEKMYAAKLAQDFEAGQVNIIGNECYLSAGLDVDVMDRLIISGEYNGDPLISGEMFKVATVKKHEYDNVWVVDLTEDTRG